MLAAGLGTRLRPLTDVRPKPLVPVCGVPLLAYSLAACARHGMREVVVNAHWLAEQIEAWAGEHEGVHVRVSTERPEVLGTGGGLRRVASSLASPVVILNGDVLQDVDLSALRAAVPPGGAAMALRHHPEDAARYGIVAADAQGVITRLSSVARAEPSGPEDLGTHFTGIHAMSAEALARLPADGPSDVVRTSYRELVPERLVRGVRSGTVWLDAGDPAAYLEANLALLSGALTTLALDPLPRAAWAVDGRGRTHGEVPASDGVHGPVWVGRGAGIGRGAQLREVVVGEGAQIAAGVRLSRVVVWDGCRVDADLADAVVYPGGVVSNLLR